jgi:hypothetical protein
VRGKPLHIQRSSSLFDAHSWPVKV